MEFDRIKTDIKNVGFDMARIDKDDYLEIVIRKVSLEGLLRVLEGIFGPSKNRVSKEMETLIKDYGGLRKGQTLFFLNNNGAYLFAMIWPWSDDERITIKVGTS